MGQFKPGKCVYCQTGFIPTNKKRLKSTRRMDDRYETEDHLYPKNVPLPASMTSAAPGALLGLIGDPRESLKNKVRCCFGCNQKKGSLPPLVWLTICPSDAGAEHVGKLLLALGEPADKVQAALNARKAQNG